MNTTAEIPYITSMSARASATTSQIMTMARVNLGQMATTLEAWGVELGHLVAHAAATGSGADLAYRGDIDDLETKLKAARARFGEFRTAGGAQWQMFRPDIVRAWNDFEVAFNKLTPSSSKGTEGDSNENSPAS